MGGEKLIQQVSIGGVNFHPVKARLFRTEGRIGKKKAQAPR